MKAKLNKFLGISLTLTLLLGIFAAFPAFADVPPGTDNYMWIEPPSVSLTTANPAHTIGYRFNVTVWVKTNFTCGAWQFKMLYNKAHLNATGCWYTRPDLVKSDFFKNITTMPVSPQFGVYDGTRDFVLHGESWVTGDKRNPGYGNLSTVEFEVLAVPEKGSSLSSTIDISTEFPGNTFLLPGKPPMIITDCSYTFVWAAPPPPNMAVEHGPYYGVQPKSPIPAPNVWPLEYGPDPPAANCSAAFDVKVYIENLAAAWNITQISFCLRYNTTVIDIIGGTANVTLHGPPGGYWTYNSSSVVHTLPLDEVNVTLMEPTAVPYGKVLLATIRFHVMFQQRIPPAPIGTKDVSPLTFCDENLILEDHTRPIPHAASKNGAVWVWALRTLAIPVIEVLAASHDVVLGPDPSIGEEFDIDVSFTELDQAWYAVGFQIRLKYDPTLLAKVSVTEGEFLTDPTWSLHGYWFYSSVQTPTPSIPHHHLLVAGLILPNASGVYDQTVFPHTSVLRMFTVRFRAIKQIKSCEPGNLSCVLGIFPMWPPTPDQWVLDRTGKYVGATTVNGTYTILNDITLGRIIDVYTQWPAPYGGQGWNRTSDMFWPQKEVILCANVTYNCWPVQQKLVTFVVWDPQMKVWTVLQAVTDENGVACVSFRIPWPCDDPESLFGVWRVRADVDIACIVVEDGVYFHFDYLINIISVETDKYQYKHCEFVDVTVTFTSHAQQQRHIAIWVTIHDELNVPVATQELVFWVGSAQWCTPKEYTKEFRLHIEKFVFAGYATVHVVSRFELLPGVWTAAGPEDTAIIFVLPE